MTWLVRDIDAPALPRSPSQTRRVRRGRPTVIDLFAGAGLMSAAFDDEGFDVKGAVELDRYAAGTYRLNLPGPVQVADVRRAKIEGPCDVLVAGPPCQGFSTIGRRDRTDPRNFLSLEVVRWAKRLRPKVVVIENVPAFLHSEVFDDVSRRLSRLGYDVAAFRLDAVDFGAPQRRARAFVVATQAPLRRDRPEPAVRFAATVREAWRDLPPVADGENLHYAPTPSPLALARMKVIPAGGDRRDVMRRAPRLAAPSWWRLNVQVTDVWGRIAWDEPSNTLKTEFNNASKGRYIHPEQHRVISLREAARLQTIPDSWRFAGFARHVARQIGNSVPPVLGRAVARLVRQHIG